MALFTGCPIGWHVVVNGDTSRRAGRGPSSSFPHLLVVQHDSADSVRLTTGHPDYPISHRQARAATPSLSFCLYYLFPPLLSTSTSPSLFLPIPLFLPLPLSFYQSLSLSTALSLSFHLYLSFYLSLFLSLSLSIFPSLYLSLSLTLQLPPY